MILDFLAAVAFLTRLPVARAFTFDAKQVARSQRWFPLVGALVGAIQTAGFWLAAPYLPPLVTAVLIVTLDAWLTGAMHYDGLADTADGFGGGRTRDEVLRIMRDHAIGSYGAAAVVLAIALKAAAIASLAGPSRAIAALIAAPVLARWSAVLLSSTQPYARPVSDDHPRSAGSPTRFVGRIELIVATITAIVIAGLCGLWPGGLSLLLVTAFSVFWAWRCRRRIGGVTGDTLGAAIAASECLVLLVYTAVRV